MAERSLSTDQLRAHKHFMDEVEMAVRAANREIIGREIPGLDKDTFFRFAVDVARIRARYLKAVLAADWDRTPDIDYIQAMRVLYEEALKAFEALERAISRGYVDIAASAKP